MPIQRCRRGRLRGLAFLVLCLLLELVMVHRGIGQDVDLDNRSWHIGYIPMKDGVKLAYLLHKPEQQQRFPVLVNYNGGAGGALVKDLEERTYLENGYGILGVSVRGTGSSQGVFTSPFTAQEADDGKAVIEWAAAQPWCNGNVGMYGNGYAGVSQLEVAAQRPQQLKALAAGSIWGDSYEEICYPGGIFNFGLVGQWSYQTLPSLSARSARQREFAGDRAGAKRRAAQPMNKLFEETQAHPLKDAWWAVRTFENLAPQIDTPLFIAQAWQDPQVGARGALKIFDKLHGPKRMLLSNGGEATLAQHRVITERRRWFDRWLKGEQNRIDKEPPVTIWFETHAALRQPGSLTGNVSGPLAKSPVGKTAPQPAVSFQPPPKPSWGSTFATWPIPDVEWSTLYLTADGRLDQTKPAVPKGNGTRFYLYPAGTEIAATNETFSTPPAPVGSLLYRTRPLPEDLAIIGSPVLTLYASSTQKDTDFMAVLHDVNPQGQVTYVQRGLLRASHRALDAAKSTPHEPIHRHDKTEELLPGQVYEIHFALLPVAHVLRRGHALELAILAPPSIPSPSWAFMPGAPAGLNTIYHSAQYASRLDLPIALKLKAPAPEPPLGSLPFQPVRGIPAKGWDNERKSFDDILRAWKREKLSPG
jgi:predicted acyl esterase